MAETGPRASAATLRVSDVPPSDGPLDQVSGNGAPPIWRFAMTYIPPADLPRELPRLLTEAAIRHWNEDGLLSDLGLDGLRLTLWGLCGQWRRERSGGDWEGRFPDSAALARAVVRQIERELEPDESWWSERGREPTDDERWQRALGRSTEGRGLSELYQMAATVLTFFIVQRDRSADDPLELPRLEQDPIEAARVRAAYLLARGLMSSMPNAPLARVRDAADRAAASLAG